jgi:hypothetical protein
VIEVKTIIAGSRTITDIHHVLEAVALSCFEVTKVISGGAAGVDRLALQYAKEKHLPVIIMKADWEKHGRKAGYLRNKAMGDIADALIAVWDSTSKGTKHMIDIAYKLGLMVYVHEVKSCGK